LFDCRRRVVRRVPTLGSVTICVHLRLQRVSARDRM
jgi:hypothetical protein